MRLKDKVAIITGAAHGMGEGGGGRRWFRFYDARVSDIVIAVIRFSTGCPKKSAGGK
jgi:hypothetical protein